ncbi:MAG: hypothetical protein NWQ44_09470 [Flavobacteriales bacterium]|jgi:hypothetical protein|nr:hypothetical protein [Flavobacteriales bacterium]MDP4717776.1 hypothetical protein [Flavobacteriales bacterium]MDP4731901.1 hypothetical protein [Flavobacteriales bacterium]MDP4818445.1 hypothetical protein [Flavobacteriales bacterium]MDP4951942.1 hypothetical protein [Flavobacteriales bacterium]
MIRNFFILLSVLFIQFGNAQIIDNREGKAFQQEMFFSQEFLWQNKISTITGVCQMKRTGKAIENRPDITVFHFNETGQLAKIDAVTSVLSIVDSTQIVFDRNELGLIQNRNELGRNGYNTTSFFYDQKGRVERIDNSVSENKSIEKLKLVPGLTVTVNSESFKYSEPSKLILRKESFNNYGLPYSIDLVYRDSSGFVTREEKELTLSSKSFSKHYTYNDKGWIAQITTIESSSNKETKRETFQYDRIGNLTKVSYYSNGILQREIEIIYSPTSFIEATLDQDMGSKDILITKYTYEFRK